MVHTRCSDTNAFIHSPFYWSTYLFRQPVVHTHSRFHLGYIWKVYWSYTDFLGKVQMFVRDVSDFWGGVSKEFCVRRLSNWFPIEMPAGSVANTRRPWRLSGCNGLFWGSIHCFVPNATQKNPRLTLQPSATQPVQPKTSSNSANLLPISITFSYFSLFTTFNDGGPSHYTPPKKYESHGSGRWDSGRFESTRCCPQRWERRPRRWPHCDLLEVRGVGPEGSEGGVCSYLLCGEMTRRCYSNLSIWHYDIARLEFGAWMCLVNQFGGNWTWRGMILANGFGKGKNGPAFQDISGFNHSLIAIDDM